MLGDTRALVTGASGFLGGALVLRLAAQGTPARALVRSQAKADALAALVRAELGALPPSLEIVLGDLNDIAALTRAMHGCGYVFHCAALLGGKLQDQRRTNVDGTRNLMQCAADAGVRRFVHVSTLSVYGLSYRGVIHEGLPPAPGFDPYGISKTEAEAVVQRVSGLRGLPYSIVRPGMIYGARASLWTGALYRFAKLRPTPWLGDGGGFAHCVHVDDVIDQMLVQAEHDGAVGEAFNCVSDPVPTWHGFINGYQWIAGHDDWIELPTAPIDALAALVMWLSPRYSRGRMMPQYLQFMQARTIFSMKKAHERLGWQPQVDLPDGMARCEAWLRATY
jgi:nucleoside-diphosphate-sugar epimerase